MAMQSPSSSSPFFNRITYQVFLSFRGSDTRYGFIGHLYHTLTDKGIHTFIDDQDLQGGDEITPSLVKAIEESKIFIPVFSINYASSSFCLDELVHIIHCYKTKGRFVLPIFYGVDPTQVRHQTGSYGEHLAKHEENFQNNNKNMVRLQQWKVALKQAANLSGHHFSSGNEYEHSFIGKIVKDISNKINRVPLYVADYLVGLKSRILEVNSLLDLESNDGVSIIGVHGTGGMGKTTLAKVVYNFISNQFEDLCFLHNVRENSAKYGLEYLQEQLLDKTIKLNIKINDVSEGITLIRQRLSRKKILLILDDVDKLKQLQCLIGDINWLGQGSKVIITTRDRQLLASYGVERTYEVCGLNEGEALELFRWKVRKNKTVDSSYEYILNRAVNYASGLPLAIEVVGSYLAGEKISEWDSTLDKYERITPNDIQSILEISYDALDEEVKSVFLDIACCFKDYNLVKVEEILNAHYGYRIKNHVVVLVEKSLVKIKHDGDVELHDLIEHMGKEIVRRESPKDPRKRSRLWFHDDIVHVLKENKGTRKIEIIHLNSPSSGAVVDWNGKAFKKMKNLKTLIIKNGNFSQGARNLPKSLRVLEWERCPVKSLSFWFLNKKFENMVLLTLNYCKYLIDIPNVSGLQNLKKFSFRNCDNLATIHKSVGHLNKVEILDAYGCKKLESFPPLRLSFLKKLELSMCTSLKNFPKLLCKMKNIKQISLHNIAIRKLPSSFKNLSELRELWIDGCRKLKYSSKIFMMPNLKLFSAVGCSLSLEKHNEKFSSKKSSNLRWDLHLKDKNLSEQSVRVVLSLWTNVSILDLSNNNIKILPECLNQCLVEELILDGCNYLEEIRGIPLNLTWFSAIGCKSLTSSCTRMLLNQEVGRPINMRLPSRLEMIPNCFEHQIRGTSISFWFRKQIPSISCIILLLDPKPSLINIELEVNLFVKETKHYLYNTGNARIEDWRSDHTYLFDLELMSQVDQAMLKNEWGRVEVKLTHYIFNDSKENSYLSVGNPQMGIHVFNEKRSMEADVRFTNPYRKRKSDDYQNESFLVDSELKPLKKQTCAEFEIGNSSSQGIKKFLPYLENFEDSSMNARMPSSSDGADIADKDQSPAVDSPMVAEERESSNMC